jgi:hypothetical protein
MTDILELAQLDVTRFHRSGGVLTFEGLDARLLVQADQVDALSM